MRRSRDELIKDLELEVKIREVLCQYSFFSPMKDELGPLKMRLQSLKNREIEKKYRECLRYIKQVEKVKNRAKRGQK